MSLLIAQKNKKKTVIQAIYDPDGRTPKTGLAGTIITNLRDEDGAASEVVTIVEQGASGYYEVSYTPTNGRSDGYSYQLDIIAPLTTSDESIYGFEVQVFDSVQFTGTSGSFLTTLAKVKAYLGIPTADVAHDTLLTDLIARVTAKAESFGRKFIAATYTDIRDGKDSPSIRILSPPIGSITSIHESEDQDFTADNEVLAADYTFDPNTGIIRKKGSVDFREGFQNVRVIYAGGYSTIPADLELAAIEHIAMIFTNRKRLGITSQSLRETAVSSIPVLDREKVFRGLIDTYMIPEIV